VVDYAAAIALAVEAAPSGSHYLVVDDQPVTQRELLEFIAMCAGVPAPEAGGPPGLSCCRACNARIKRELGWYPTFPTYRSGLA
jgi:nucleoside-diphosphate-sugar epimerase